MSTKLFCLGITPDSSLGLILKLLRFLNKVIVVSEISTV